MLNKDEQTAFNKLVGQLIKDAREGKSIKQEALSNFLGFKSRISITHIEKGKQNIQLTTLVEIADYLKIPISDLIPPLEAIKKNVSKRLVKGIEKEGVFDPDANARIQNFVRLASSKNKND